MILTAWIIALVAIVLIAYDVWTCIKRGTSTSISWTTYSWSKSYPIIPFALGVLLGHLLWVQHGG
jgi:phosphotransferase system  glucose/maltose/N-acetylglucosamine-specific IIC component